MIDFDKLNKQIEEIIETSLNPEQYNDIKQESCQHKSDGIEHVFHTQNEDGKLIMLRCKKCMSFYK